VPPDPELTIAKGATLAAQRLVPAAGVPAPVNPDEPDEEPPPRPSIEINPLDLPAPRSVMRTITNMKPSILGGAGAVVVMAGVLLTIMLRPEPPAQQAPPASGPATSAATPSHAGSKSTITAPTQQTGKDGH
jgi:molecular chaperone DnaK